MNGHIIDLPIDKETCLYIVDFVIFLCLFYLWFKMFCLCRKLLAKSLTVKFSVYPFDKDEVVVEHRANFHYINALPKCQVILYHREKDTNKLHAVGQAFFTAANVVGYDNLLTAEHCLVQPGEYWIGKGDKSPKIKVMGTVSVDGPQNDLVLLQVAKGTINKFGSAVAALSSRCLNGASVQVTAGGLRNDGKILASTGVVRALTGKEGCLACVHSASTEAGFSGAPIFSGRAVVGIHLTTVPGKINAGCWVWPALGSIWEYKAPVLSSESDTTISQLEDFDEFYADEDYVFIRGKNGQFRKMTADNFYDQVQVKLIEKNAHRMVQNMETYWDDVGSELEDEARQPSVHSISRSTSLQSLHSDYSYATPEAKIPLPIENLEPENVALATTIYGKIMETVAEFRASIDLLKKTGSLALAERDEAKAQHIAGDVFMMDQFSQNVSENLVELNDTVSRILQKSATDDTESKKWARKRKNANLPATAATINYVHYVDNLIGEQLALLREITLRPRHEDSIPELEVATESKESEAMLSQYLPGYQSFSGTTRQAGLVGPQKATKSDLDSSYQNPIEQSTEQHDNGKLSKTEPSNGSQQVLDIPQSLPQPKVETTTIPKSQQTLKPESSTTGPTAQKKRKTPPVSKKTQRNRLIGANSQLIDPLFIQETSMNTFREQMGLLPHLSPATQERCVQRFQSIKESLLPPENDVVHLLENLSETQLTALRDALVKSRSSPPGGKILG